MNAAQDVNSILFSNTYNFALWLKQLCPITSDVFKREYILKDDIV